MEEKKKDQQEKVCVNCGKKITGSTKYVKQGNVYCCEKCCHIGKQANVCEFC